MKSTLLLYTALTAVVGLISAGSSNAQTAAQPQPLAITLGGYVTQVFKGADLEDNRTLDGRRDTAINSDSEIWFNIRGVLDNGTVVGARVELEAQTEADQIDERYMFIEHRGGGRVELGSTDRAASKMVYAAPTAIPGYGTVDPTGSIAVTVAPTGARTSGNLTKFSAAPDDGEGINIFSTSNRWFGSKAGKGLQLGLSYTPDSCQDFSGNSNTCGGGFPSKTDPGQPEDAFTLAANYLESFGPVDLALFAAYNRFGIEATSAGSLADGSATVFGNSGLQGYTLGTTVTYNIGGGSSVQVGGAWKQEEMGVTPSGDDERNFYAFGVRYLTNGNNPGSIGIGADYAVTKADQGNIGGTLVAGEDEFTWYSLGVTYQVARGVLAFGGIGRYEYDDAIAAGTVVGGTAQLDNDSKVNFGILGLRLDF